MRLWKSLKVLTLVEVRNMFRNPMPLIFNLVGPVTFMLVFGLVFRPDTSTPQIGLVIRDQGPVAQAMVKPLESSDTIAVVRGDEADLRRQLSRGELSALVILPAGLSERFNANQVLEMTAVVNRDTEKTRQIVTQVQQLLGGSVTAIRGVSTVVMAPVEELAPVEPLRLIDQLIPGILTFMLLNANLTGVAHTVVSQRENGILRHLFSTPLSPWGWLTARIFAHLILGLVQLALILAVGVLMLGAPIPGNFMSSLLVLVVCTLAPLSIGLALGTMFRRLETAQPIIMVAALILPFLGGAFLPLSEAPVAMQKLAVFVPASQMMQSLKLVVVQGKSLTTAAGPLGILVLWTVLCLAVGARVLRKQTTVG